MRAACATHCWLRTGRRGAPEVAWVAQGVAKGRRRFAGGARAGRWLGAGGGTEPGGRRIFRGRWPGRRRFSGPRAEDTIGLSRAQARRLYRVAVRLDAPVRSVADARAHPGYVHIDPISGCLRDTDFRFRIVSG